MELKRRRLKVEEFKRRKGEEKKRKGEEIKEYTRSSYGTLDNLLLAFDFWNFDCFIATSRYPS
ncbi:MAG: hypothetical protein RIC95_06920 [Vicingaceae bacterium]